METINRLTIENLLVTYLQLPQEIRNDAGGSSFTIALGIVKYFLGNDWIEKHINPEIPEKGFVRLAKADDPTGYIQSFRIVDLGELLFNLQHIEGFDACVERMKSGPPEPSIAELDIGRMLYINNHSFRFIIPTGRKKFDYDFEISFGQWTICADAKCKISNTAISVNTIINTLHEGREQLPANTPGALFVKIPQEWMTTPHYEQMMVESAETFFSRGTGRIVSVKFYIAPFHVQNGFLAQGHRFKEVTNRRNRFDTSKTWNLFTYRPPVGALNTMPPKWLRLVDFPNGIKTHEPRDR